MSKITKIGNVYVVGDHVIDCNRDFTTREFDDIATALTRCINDRATGKKVKAARIPDKYTIMSISLDWLGNVYNRRTINGTMTPSLENFIRRVAPVSTWNDKTKVYIYTIAVAS